MKDRLTELLDKYWEGETSLMEEAELKSLLKKTDLYPELRRFFSGTEQLAEMDIGITKTRKIGFEFFMRIAAVFIGFIVIGSLIYNNYHQREQEKAYFQVMEAFALIQSNMARGTEELQVLDELRHLNMPHELFNINELNEQ
ncbi:hypothetical protein [Lunatibacter salilacus]|uniref:hypothetical protein n=1 Tax=Lunatibacter salilacus TaxID=2483804 RepID=UPI00131E7C7F|nr:hypothetical protein [Lunatibacter salilacus]